ncbi:MAG: efflux RND transporter periplasmic adaptor subunit, partial [Pseudomonadota bacterium]|nr:efflux RND transporter periplasmic adaptor subunit [Pseudomonadota bacterium]
MISDRFTTIIRDRRGRLAIIAAAVALLIAAAAAAYLALDRESAGEADGACPGSEVLYWYDPMVPDRRFDQPGKSPFMDMQLVPKCADEAAGGVRVSPAMVQNLGIRTTQARMMDIAPSVHAVGRVELDERLIAEVQTLTPGFVETLAVRAEGEPISRGSRVATVYSPELLAAQQEYAALVRMRGSAVTPSLREAAGNRLRLLGLPSGAIQRLSRGGAPQRTYPVFAPVSGIVREIGARPGAQVTPGQSIVTLTDLSRVLVIAQVPEVA